MERRAAVEYLLKIAEITDNTKFSTIVNDLARRVALSIEQDEINLDKFCSKMAAELMFRDDYANASKLMKIAEDATKPSEDVLPVDNTDQQEEIEEPVNETSKFIEENLPESKPSELPPLDSNKLNDFIARLQGGGAVINQDDSENNQTQTAVPQPQENQNL
jgi:actin-like ATPase involved in cell morphogenesis